MIRLEPRRAVQLILAVRFVLGTCSFVFPRFTFQRLMFGSPEHNRGVNYLLRLFGARDVFLGVAALMADEPVRTKLVGSAAAIDALDAASALVAGWKGEVSRPAGLSAGVAGSIGCALGLAALGRGPLAKPARKAVDAPTRPVSSLPSAYPSERTDPLATNARATRRQPAPGKRR